MSGAASGLLSALGLCRKAGRTVLGTDQICEEMRCGKHRIYAVFEASDTSENTHKRLGDKCAYYGVKLYRTDADTLTLGAALGKDRAVAAVGITDEGLARLAESKYSG